MSNAADWISAIAEAATACAAFIALLFGIFQVKSARRQQREATAKALYGEAMRMGFLHTDLAVPDYKKLAAENRFKEYHFYLAHLLYACEEILLNLGDPEWRDAVKFNLAMHASYIGSDDFQYGKGYYADELVKIMRQAVLEHEALIDPYLRHGGAYQPPSLARA